MVITFFGTDSTGQGCLQTRIIYGGQISLMIGILAVFLGSHHWNSDWRHGSILWRLGGCHSYALYRAMLSIPSLFLLIVLAKFLATTYPR